MLNYIAQIEDAIYRLRRNYPLFDSPFSACASDKCEISSRGGGYCASCCEKKLAKISKKPDTANRFHSAIKKAHNAQIQLMREEK